MIIFLDTEFVKGERVRHKADADKKFIVTGYLITSIRNEKAEEYFIECSDGVQRIYHIPEEIEHDTMPKLN